MCTDRQGSQTPLSSEVDVSLLLHDMFLSLTMQIKTFALCRHCLAEKSFKNVNASTIALKLIGCLVCSEKWSRNVTVHFVEANAFILANFSYNLPYSEISILLFPQL